MPAGSPTPRARGCRRWRRCRPRSTSSAAPPARSNTVGRQRSSQCASFVETITIARSGTCELSALGERIAAYGQRVRPRAASARVASSTRSTASWSVSHSSSAAHPVLAASSVASKSSSSRARCGSATQWRMSPARYWPLRIGSTSACRPAASVSRDLQHGARAPGAEVDRVPGRLFGLEREPDRAHDVADVDEVARLAPVLEDHRRAAVEQPRGEDRRDARVGVRQRLPGP